ncbi:MAG: hypothetical protein Q4A27_01595 [bacterium]|nr:hypothetical protein [bacterium]
MNFRQEENRNPQLSEPDFNVPQNTFYAPENQTAPNQTAQVEEVQPFQAPEYRKNLSEDSNQNPEFESAERQFEEREIANWQAQEMFIGEKSKRWFLAFYIVVAILVALAIWMQLWTFAALIIVSAVAIMVTRRENQANMVAYALSTRGVYIGNNFYPYSDFRTFGIVREAQVYSIVLIPKKRFSPATSIYFPASEGEKITDIIGQRLPMEEVKLDIIDRIIRKIKL